LPAAPAGDHHVVAIEMQTPARFRREKSARGLRLVVAGELDWSNRDLLASILAALIAEGEDRIEVDLFDVTYLGSDAIGALILAFADAAEAGVSMTLIASPAVDTMLALTGLTGVLATV
jgi:anti-anti-sigma factor